MPERMKPILRLWPKAKFVIALRDPLSMLPSLHARLLVTGDETIRDFPAAWAKIGERAAGRSIPKGAVDPRWLRYDWAGELGYNVQRFLETVGRERCHIVLFDDLARDPEGTYRRLCDFLGVPVPPQPYPRVNTREAMNQRISQQIHQTRTAPPSPEEMTAMAGS